MKTIRDIGTHAVSTRRLTLGGIPLQLRLQWLDRIGQWSLSVLTPEGVGILQGVRLVCGTALTSRGAQPGMPTGTFLCVDMRRDGPDPLDAPGRDDLASGRCRLLWIEQSDIAALPASTSDALTATSVVVS